MTNTPRHFRAAQSTYCPPRPRSGFTVIAMLAAAFLLAACASNPKGLTGEHNPRHDQNRWVDENLVINTVVQCVNNADFASRRPAAVKEYATLLRLSYMRVSEGGVDVDAGVRALNFIYKIHRDANGDRKLWQDVVERAKDTTDDAGRLLGLPIPPKFH
ncbi:MAG: hypothetical protein BWX73_03068 [Lentisphaerae bacterium ADurb.Bin082]|nr:MAG: hypothetical protein BWX73_03068 [Lentisphaerae bacterium ADurb.Bin082]